MKRIKHGEAYRASSLPRPPLLSPIRRLSLKALSLSSSRVFDPADPPQPALFRSPSAFPLSPARCRLPSSPPWWSTASLRSAGRRIHSSGRLLLCRALLVVAFSDKESSLSPSMATSASLSVSTTSTARSGHGDLQDGPLLPGQRTTPEGTSAPVEGEGEQRQRRFLHHCLCISLSLPWPCLLFYRARTK